MIHKDKKNTLFKQRIILDLRPRFQFIGKQDGYKWTVVSSNEKDVTLKRNADVHDLPKFIKKGIVTLTFDWSGFFKKFLKGK